MSTLTPVASGTPATAAISATKQVENFILSAHIPDTPGQSGILIDIPASYPSMVLISKGFQNFGKEIPTFIDSGASDTMFVMFTECKPTVSRVGDSAKAVDGGFKILSEGNVVQRYQVNGKECSITYTRTLHTPALNANLISISSFDRAGFTTTFTNGQGIIRKSDESPVLAGKHVNSMYLLETIDNIPFTINSMSQPTSLEQWHC
jgi:hypothetical protein